MLDMLMTNPLLLLAQIKMTIDNYIFIGKYQAEVGTPLLSCINFVDNGVIWGADCKYDVHLWRE